MGGDPTKQYYRPSTPDSSLDRRPRITQFAQERQEQRQQGLPRNDRDILRGAPQGKSLGSSPAGQAIDTELKNAISSTLLGKKSPDEALADAQTAAKRAYDQVAG